MNSKPHFFDEIKKAIKIREVENSLLRIFKQGLLNGTVHTCVGQEFTGVFVSKYLNSNDHIVSNHRGHGHYLSRFDDVYGLVAELMGKTTGCSGGFGGSQHIVNKNYLSNGIQGGMVPLAVGIGLYRKIEQKNSISVAYIGDGTLGEGVIYESFNIASKLNSPLLVILENNGIAQSTSMQQTFAGDLKKRAEGFGLKFYETSTNDLADLDKTCNDATTFVRKFQKPALINIKTSRINSHSKGDDNRDLKEILKILKNDYLTELYDSNNKLINDFIKNTQTEIDEIINKIIKDPDLIFYECKTEKKLLQKYNGLNYPHIENENLRYNQLINEALDEVLKQDKNSIIIGEDIEDSNKYNPGEYGGAFKVTKNLSIKYPNQVKNMPISEASITGIAAGYCIAGGSAVLEIMFGDFITLIFDQILQHCSKFEIMYNKKVKCPLIIRTPMGGKRGYGPTHSQSLEKHFLGIPNFAVIALNHRISPKFIFENIKHINSTPFLVVENKILYTTKPSIKKIPSYNYSFSKNIFPDLIIKANIENPQLTIICYGGVLIDIEEVCFDLLIEEEIFVEIICSSLISHPNIENFSESLKKTSKLLIVEEGPTIASWGSEIVSKLIEKNIKINHLCRVGNNEIIPSSFKAELNILPNKLNIKKSILNIVNL